MVIIVAGTKALIDVACLFLAVAVSVIVLAYASPFCHWYSFDYYRD